MNEGMKSFNNKMHNNLFFYVCKHLKVESMRILLTYMRQLIIKYFNKILS